MRTYDWSLHDVLATDLGSRQPQSPYATPPRPRVAGAPTRARIQIYLRRVGCRIARLERLGARFKGNPLVFQGTI